MASFRPKSTFGVLAAALLLLGACDPVMIGGASAVSLMGTDKTVVDHVVSYGSGKNCSWVRKEQGQTYCVEDELQIRQNIYCYRSLGGVDCYEKPRPNGTRQQRVDRNDHNLAK